MKLRYIYIISILLTISSCISIKTKRKCISNSDEAIKIAEKKWLSLFGEEVNNKKPFMAIKKNDSIWYVYGTLLEEYVGGFPYAEINAKNCEILVIGHSK